MELRDHFGNGGADTRGDIYGASLSIFGMDTRKGISPAAAETLATIATLPRTPCAADLQHYTVVRTPKRAEHSGKAPTP